MFEKDLIESITTNFKKSKDQLNTLYESDCEILKLGDKTIGLSMDEFSAKEDFFDDTDLFSLGKNLAIATIHDLLIAGCTPSFYMHSIVSPKHSPHFAGTLSQGIRTILDECRMYLVGGDIGTSDIWRYTGLAIGDFYSESPISRIFPKKPQTLWVTGTLGGINVNALIKIINDIKSRSFFWKTLINIYSKIISKPGYISRNFKLNSLVFRFNEFKYLRKFILGGIDTSGGFMESMYLLSTLNPNMAFYLDPSRIPYHDSVIHLCAEKLIFPFKFFDYNKKPFKIKDLFNSRFFKLKIPKEAFLIGEAGEYEFLFTTNNDVEIENATKIGKILPLDDKVRESLFQEKKNTYFLG